VEIPKKLTERQRQLLRDFAATEDDGDARVMPQKKSFVEKLRQKLTGDS